MRMRRSPLAAVVLALVASCAGAAGAAELRLRDRCETGATVVALGDLAEVFGGDPQEVQSLQSIELFPTPAAGQRRYVKLRELEDLLVLRGVNTAACRFSGAAQVEIVRASPAARGPETRATTSMAKRAERLVREAIVRHLQEHAGKDEPWSVEVVIDEQDATALSSAGDRLVASGGKPFWTGEQQFDLTLETAQGRAVVPVRATVSLPAAVVVALRAIPRGSLVQATDVALDRGASSGGDQGGFRSVGDVIGREATRAIPAGKVIEQDYLRSPILVRRGQAVTVHARAAGIHVRTTARARDDGGQGDLVSVESLLDRKAYHARVCGIQEVEVYARAVAARDGPEGETSEGKERK